MIFSIGIIKAWVDHNHHHYHHGVGLQMLTISAKSLMFSSIKDNFFLFWDILDWKIYLGLYHAPTHRIINFDPKCVLQLNFYSDGIWPLMEDTLWWKRTFDGRRHLMVDDFWWKATFDGRQPLTETDLWWKATFDGRQPLMEDDMWWNITLHWRQTLMKDDLVTTHNVRRPFE